MYESPRLASINSINRGYGIGYGLNAGVCNVNAAVNVNVGVNVNAAAAANAVAVALVISHYTPLGELGPWARDEGGECGDNTARVACCTPK